MTALLAEAARHAAVSNDEVEVSWVAPDAVGQALPLSDAWAVAFEGGLPVRRFTARKGAAAFEWAVVVRYDGRACRVRIVA